MDRMRGVRAVALALVAILGVVAVAAPAPVASTGGAPGAAPGAAATPTANNSTMGGSVSSFMHASSGETSEAVQDGMWNAAYEDAPDKRAVVEERTGDLEARLAALAAEKRALVEARRNGTISETEFRARMSAVVGRMAALNRSIDETERQARASGANVTAVEELRTRVTELSGPEIAAIARTLAGGPPEDLPSQASNAPKNGSGGPPEGTPPGKSNQDGNKSGSGQTPGGGQGGGTPGGG